MFTNHGSTLVLSASSAGPDSQFNGGHPRPLVEQQCLSAMDFVFLAKGLGFRVPCSLHVTRGVTKIVVRLWVPKILGAIL